LIVADDVDPILEVPAIPLPPTKRAVLDKKRTPEELAEREARKKAYRKKRRKWVAEGRKAIRHRDYDNPKAAVAFRLTDEDRTLCRAIVVYGLEWLRHTKGWTAISIQTFINRNEIRREIETLRRMYQDRVGIQERTQFFAQLQVNIMVPAAVSILARALRGEHEDPVTSKVIEPPTKGQYLAAMEVLNRANIQGERFGGADTAPTIDARQVRIAIGASSDLMQGLSAQGREKIRQILSRVVSRVRMVDHHTVGERERTRDAMISRGQDTLRSITGEGPPASQMREVESRDITDAEDGDG
jgi:hypothetical protein